jgi:hypothetical protein
VLAEAEEKDDPEEVQAAKKALKVKEAEMSEKKAKNGKCRRHA